MNAPFSPMRYRRRTFAEWFRSWWPWSVIHTQRTQIDQMQLALSDSYEEIDELKESVETLKLALWRMEGRKTTVVRLPEDGA